MYARVAELPQHDAARDWLDRRLNGTARVGLAWPSLVTFLRIVTNPRIFERAERSDTAWMQVERWLDCEPAWIPTPTERHRETLGRLLPETSGQPDLVADADLAALAIEHGLTLCSMDRDFARFPGLRWENPLGPRP